MLDTIKNDLNNALRSSDDVSVRTLRMLSAALTNARIAAGKDLSDDEVIVVVRKEAKLRKDAMDSYKKAGRPDLEQKEEAELAVLDRYLPAPLSDEEVQKAVGAAIAELNATDLAQMGQVMGSAMKKLGPSADGSVVSQEAKRQLQEK